MTNPRRSRRISGREPSPAAELPRKRRRAVISSPTTYVTPDASETDAAPVLVFSQRWTITEEVVQMEASSCSSSEEETVYYDNTDFDRDRFEPVWDEEQGYPGEIPEEILEFFPEGGPDDLHAQMVGPARTIFHLCGRPDIVHFFDDPAYVLEDEIVVIPYGCYPTSFLLRRYMEEGKVPIDTPTSLQVAIVSAVEIPSQVTTSVTTQRLIDIFPNCRPLDDHETVRCLQSRHHKDPGKFVMNTKRLFADGLLDKHGLMFMGVSLRKLEQCLSFFVPVICSANLNNEFGPGLYTISTFELAKTYAETSGAIMVFDKLDERGLQVWRPALDAWNHLTATWLKLPLSNIRLPSEYRTAEVIVGPTSCNQLKARRTRTFASQSDDTQFAFVSYQGCSQLRKSLLAIIFIT